jgi:hypothetical protein
VCVCVGRGGGVQGTCALSCHVEVLLLLLLQRRACHYHCPRKRRRPPPAPARPLQRQPAPSAPAPATRWRRPLRRRRPRPAWGGRPRAGTRWPGSWSASGSLQRCLPSGTGTRRCPPAMRRLQRWAGDRERWGWGGGLLAPAQLVPGAAVRASKGRPCVEAGRARGRPGRGGARLCSWVAPGWACWGWRPPCAAAAPLPPAARPPRPRSPSLQRQARHRPVSPWGPQRRLHLPRSPLCDTRSTHAHTVGGLGDEL